MNVKNSVGFIVSGLLALVVYVYPRETKQILNNLLGFVFHVPAGDVGYYLVLSVFVIAFIYFAITSLSSCLKWVKKRAKSRKQITPEPSEMSGQPGVPRSLRFEIETTSDWTTIEYKNGIDSIGTSWQVLEGKENFIEEGASRFHINKRPSEKFRLLLSGKFMITDRNPILILQKGSVGYTTLTLVDSELNHEVDKTTNSRNTGGTNDLEIKLNFDYLWKTPISPASKEEKKVHDYLEGVSVSVRSDLLKRKRWTLSEIVSVLESAKAAEPKSLEELLKFRRSATANLEIEHLITQIDDIINPIINPRKIDHRYFTKNSGQISDGLISLGDAFGHFIADMSEASEIVWSATDLAASLKKIYEEMIGYTNKITTELSKVGKAISPDNIRWSWNNLKLLLTNKVTEPWRYMLQGYIRDLVEMSELRKRRDQKDPVENARGSTG
jgi:hypothetical protein